MTKVHITFGDKAGIQSKYPQITTVLCNFRVNFCHRTQVFNCQAVYTPNALIFKYLLSACTAAITFYFMLYYLRCLHNTQNVYKSQCFFGVQKNLSVPI